MCCSGQGALAGAAVLGLGGLAFYGLGFSSEVGAVEKQMIWPSYVKERIKDTYMYFGGSILATAGTAAAVFRYIFFVSSYIKIESSLPKSILFL